MPDITPDPTDGLGEAIQSAESAETIPQQDFGFKTTVETSQEFPRSAEEVFDPNIHATDMFGNPRRTLAGRLMKKRGRQKGQTMGGVTTPPPPVNDSLDPIKRRAAATMYVGLLVGIPCNIFGDEWIPNEQLHERENMIVAFDEYIAATGNLDLPPGLTLALVVSGYAIPRFGMPKTREKIGSVIAYIKPKRKSPPHIVKDLQPQNDRMNGEH